VSILKRRKKINAYKLEFNIAQKLEKGVSAKRDSSISTLLDFALTTSKFNRALSSGKVN